MPWTVKEEQAEHFVVHGDSGPFRVHKGNLSANAISGMRKMCKGGKVQGLAEGGTAGQEQPAPSADDLIAQNKLALARARADLEPKPSGGAPGFGGSGDSIDDAPMPDAAQATLAARAGIAGAPGAGDVKLAESKAAGIAGAPGAGDVKLAESKEGDKARVQEATPGAPARATAPGASPFPAMPKEPDYGQAQRDLNESQTMGEAGASSLAKAEAAKGAALGDVYSKRMDGEQAAWNQNVADRAAAQSQQDKIFTDLLNPDSDIKPEHFWADKSGFYKFRAGLGMILSGIGSGLTGQPNMAAQFIQQSIDRDIDAQKANLSKKWTEMGWSQKRIANANDRLEMSRAHLLTAGAAEVAKIDVSQFGPEAEARKQMAISQMRSEAVNKQIGITDRAYQAKMQRMGMEFERAKFQLGANMVGGGAGTQPAGYLPSLAAPPQGTDPMKPLEFKAQATKDQSERTLRGPGGASFMAHPGVAEKMRPELSALEQTKDTLDRMEAIRQRNKAGILPGTDDAKNYDQYLHSLGESWAMGNGLNQPNAESMENLKGIIPTQWDDFVHGKRASEPIHRLLAARQASLWLSAGLHPSALPPDEFARGKGQ